MAIETTQKSNVLAAWRLYAGDEYVIVNLVGR